MSCNTNYALNNHSKQIITLIDTSGSMNGIPIRECEKAVNSFSDYVRKVDGKMIRYCALGFNHNVYQILDWDWSKQNSDKKISLTAYGGTNLPKALNAAVDKLREEHAKNRKEGCEKPALIVISDGYADSLSHVRSFVEAYREEYDLFFLGVAGCEKNLMSAFPNAKELQCTTAGSYHEILNFLIYAVEGENTFAAA